MISLNKVSSFLITKEKISLGSLTTNIQHSARNLGVTLDSSFKFDKQVSTVVRNSFLHLRTIAKANSLLSPNNLSTVVNASITSRLDYCNALNTACSDSLPAVGPECTHTPTRVLHSADQLFLAMPMSNRKTRGDGAFSIAAPRLWSAVHFHRLAAQSLDAFKSSPKSIFSRACNCV